MNKTEIIETLYKAGKITFEEAMTLASKEETKLEPTMYGGAWMAHKTTIDMNKNNFINSLIEPTYEEDHNTGEKILLSLDLDKIISIMHHIDHKWYNHVTGQMEEVTLVKLKDYLTRTVRTCIEEFIDQNGECKVNDYRVIDCAGFLIICKWENKEMTNVEVSVRYVPVETTDFIEYDKIA